MVRSIVPRSLRGRLTVAFVGVIAVAMVILAAVVPEIARAHLLAALENRLTDEARLLADDVVVELNAGREAGLDLLAKRLGRETQTRFTIIRLDGTVVGESHQELAQVGNHAGRREVQQALSAGRGVDLHHSETVGYDMLYVAVPIRRNGQVVGTARASLPLSEVDRLVADLARAILLAAGASGLLAMIVAFFAARTITRPLAALTRAAAALADDPRRRGRVRPSHGPAEVVQLGNTLDHLATAVRESLQRIAAERDRLDAVLGNLADGIVIVDSGGHVTRLNAAAERLLGIRERVASGRTAAEVLREHELIELVEGARTKAGPLTAETAFLERQSPRRFLRAAVSRFGFGDASQTLLILQDLTELRRLETIRRDFVSNVSHELRTPVAALQAIVETLEGGAIDDPPAARDFVARAHEEVDGLRQVVEELLELSRLESGRVGITLSPVSPRQLVETAVRRLTPLAERAGLRVEVAVPEGLPPVQADAERTGQVLVNLLHNAIKFTPPGGSVVLSAALDGAEVRVSVADTGVGIAPAALPRIFERFYKADQARSGGGTGLGLAIAKHTVEAHGGRIWAESPGPGQGATISFTLPVAS